LKGFDIKIEKMRKYKVWQGDELEYVIKVKEKKDGIHYKMYRSNGAQWADSARGELVEHWLDTGNHLEGLDVNNKDVDYDKFDRLKLMIDFIHKYDKNLFAKYKIKKT